MVVARRLVRNWVAIRFSEPPRRRIEAFVEKRVEQAPTGIVARGEARLQPVAQRHQLIDLRDDPALFGQGLRQRKRLRDLIQTDIRQWCLGCEKQVADLRKPSRQPATVGQL